LTIVDPALFLVVLELEAVVAVAVAVAEAVAAAAVSDDVRVTPAKAQFFLAFASAFARSVPLQLLAKHVAVVLTKTGSRHRQWTSPG